MSNYVKNTILDLGASPNSEITMKAMYSEFLVLSFPREWRS